MILERARVLTLLATAGALGFAPGDTAAQSTPTDSLRIPALMISVGAGGARDMGDWAATGGVRIVAHARPAVTDVQRRQRPIQATVAPAEAAGKAVRVSLANGARRHGRFVSLSTSELLLRDGGQDIRYPLDQVVLVETVHNTARNAALVGCGVGLAAEEPVGRALDLPVGLALAMTCGIGTGAGAFIGVLMDMAAADKHVIYLAPTLTPTRAGGTLTVRW